MRKKHPVKLLCTILTFLLVFTGCTVRPENIEQTQSTSTTTPQTEPSTTPTVTELVPDSCSELIEDFDKYISAILTHAGSNRM